MAGFAGEITFNLHFEVGVRAVQAELMEQKKVHPGEQTWEAQRHESTCKPNIWSVLEEGVKDKRRLE